MKVAVQNIKLFIGATAANKKTVRFKIYPSDTGSVSIIDHNLQCQVWNLCLLEI